ncbi:hypothetical protein [Bradyrhizobium betae]|uniref:Uncharacterized protein n=1 Tax=Bradyrhizobium betae TaxID=244734 RepID=A0A5P6PAW7_9BRAD|nr:hypothetical protein [Bradyrhizobium betae]MCS3726492.1 hypothetical protein [Bradyrhizobium betae]QFI75509.1 hypothetical protein F8237_25805 [Bradyrhizobium betae]
MTFPVVVLVVIWILGLLFIAGLYLNDVRVVLNNISPGAELSMLPVRPTLANKAAAIVSLASLEALILTVLSSTIGRVLKLNHAASVEAAQDPDGHRHDLASDHPRRDLDWRSSFQRRAASQRLPHRAQQSGPRGADVDAACTPRLDARDSGYRVARII